MYRIGSKIVEELKEQGLNATDLLQAHAKTEDKIITIIDTATSHDGLYEIVTIENTGEAVAQMKEFGFDEKSIKAIRENATKHGEDIRILRFLGKDND